MRIEEIWRYPVKSLGGESLADADVDELGIVGDRAWGLRDVETGLVLTARREPALLFLSAHLVDGHPVITDQRGGLLPDDATLSAHLGRPVELVPAGDGPGTFESATDIERESEWVRWESSGGTFHDGGSKVSFVSRASLGEWDQRRFRINLLLDGEGDDALTGELRAGSATLTVRKPITRCVMVTRAQPGLDRDLGVLRRIAAERGNRLGVGAVVTATGRIAVGDDLVPA